MRCGRECEQLASALEILAAARTQEAVPPDFREAARQHVLEKPGEERVDREGDRSRLVSAPMRVPEGDTAVGEALEPLIREGDAIDIAREIEHRVVARADLLHVHRPPSLPHAGIDLVLDPSAGKRVTHRRAKDPREHVAGEKEATVSGPDPGRAIRGQATGSDEEMGVGMVLQRPGPGVEHGEDAESTADPSAIIGDGLHRTGGFTQERGVDDTLMPPRHGAELMREREGEEVMIAGEQATLHVLQPELRAIPLALRAVAIATGVIAVVERAAVVTPVERPAECRRAAVHDILQGAALGRQKAPGVRLHVRRSRHADNVRQLDHGA